jgi:hypothetical protein
VTCRGDRAARPRTIHGAGRRQFGDRGHSRRAAGNLVGQFLSGLVQAPVYLDRQDDGFSHLKRPTG